MSEKDFVEGKEPSYESSKEVKHIDNADVNVKLANPLSGIPHDQIMADAAQFAEDHGLGHLKEELQKGALVAQSPTEFESLSQLSEDDKAILRRETTHRWDQPWQLYYLVILCSLAAAVQGVSSLYSLPSLCELISLPFQMDESVINGANLFFAGQFGIPQTGPDASRNQWLLGLVNSAPYVCLPVHLC